MTMIRTALRGRRRQLYLSLLAASFVFQLFWPRPPEPGVLARVVRVPMQDRAGSSLEREVEIAFRDWGEGEPVILLHGSPGSGRQLTRLGAMLGRRFRVITPDLPGFGASGTWVTDYSNRAHARYVFALMDELDIEAAHVFGYSMGGGVAIHMADIAPHRVKSMAMYGGIGVQEGEGTGNYRFEHLKYGVGYALTVVLPEFLPHFGLLGPRGMRHAFMRNFWDSDQRPNRAILERTDIPLLILHGLDDPLVPAWVAREHHRIVKNSRLVMFDASHFMVFRDEGSRILASEIAPFIDRHIQPDEPEYRTTADLPDEIKEPSRFKLKIKRGMSPWAQMGIIMVSTFVTEDFTCIASGLLVRADQLDLVLAILSCTLGIFLGDLGLWFIGLFVGPPVLNWKPIAKRLPPEKVRQLETMLDQRTAALVLASRFVPGTRMPLYLTAGAIGKARLRFIFWFAVGAVLWTPILIIAAAIAGERIIVRAEAIFGRGWIALIASLILIFLLFRIVEMLLTRQGRMILMAKVSRLWRWEFWPASIFYAPIVPYITYLAFKHRGLTTPTAANPCMPHGGFVGESKHEIMHKLPPQWCVPTELIETGSVERRLAHTEVMIARDDWSIPFILKPDAGQRGAGVRLIHSLEEAREYFETHEQPVVAQPYHPGPFEAGVFYCRLPDATHGHIFSITDKHFQYAIGDGVSTLEELIWTDKRLRMQARAFLKRHAEDLGHVLPRDERLRLVIAGNHCQGTMFTDGSHLITPELEASLDEILKCVEGFYFGRLDARYSDVETFKRGEGFKIIELNGLTSESTNIYDPSWTLLRAYRTLYRQWRIAFEIGAQNRKRGVPVTPLAQLARESLRFYRRRSKPTLAD